MTTTVEVRKIDSLRAFLAAERDGECKSCHGLFDAPALTLRHATPLTNGGLSEAGNLMLLCGGCAARLHAGSVS